MSILTDSAMTALHDSTMLVSHDSLAHDTTAVRTAPIVHYFHLPSVSFTLTPAQRAEYLFQDLPQLLSWHLPVLPLVTGEVGWPRHIASAELPARLIATTLDSVWWIPGVYGTVDFTSLPEANHMRSLLTSMPNWFVAQHGAAGSFAMASDSLNFSQPLSSAEYSKGPFGADAVRVNLSRALSKRMTAVLHATFSNNDGQYVDLPYDGHKAMGKFDYRLNARTRLRYRHFNTRNEAGIAVPFFLEEQAELTNARHKEERLYHSVEWERAHAFAVRLFAWQIKEELFDTARLVRHRLRDWGSETLWQHQRDRVGVSAHMRWGSEELRSTSLVSRARFYQEASVQAALRVHSSWWLQSTAYARHKHDWPSSYNLVFAGIYQKQTHQQLWAKLGYYQIAPALAERESELPYLSRNEQLRAARLLHAQLGGQVQLANLHAQFALGQAQWQRNFNYTLDSRTIAFPEFGDSVQVISTARLRNQDEARYNLGAQMQVQWQPARHWFADLHGAWAQSAAARAIWFWQQPESFFRATLGARLQLFEKTIVLTPRFAVNYLGARRAPIFSTTALTPTYTTVPGVATADLQLRLLYGEGALFFSWENLFDERFEVRAGVPHPGRIFRWGFWWKFLN